MDLVANGTPLADVTGIGQGNANKALVSAANNYRSVLVTALAANTAPVRIGNADVDQAKGTELSAGDSLLWIAQEACYVCATDGSGPSVSAVEFGG